MKPQAAKQYVRVLSPEETNKLPYDKVGYGAATETNVQLQEVAWGDGSAV